MDIRSFFEPESCTWSHLVADAASGSGVVIDPVWVFDPVTGQTSDAFTQAILETASAMGVSIFWVLETHAHADHLSSAGLICEQTGARVAIGQGIRDIQANFKKVFNLDGLVPDGSQFDRLVADGDVIEAGGLQIRVMETPGHTSDSVTYVVDKAAFIGDTLFAPGYGSARCDFPGGDAARLYESIQAIHALPDGTELYLCHDYPEKGSQPRAVILIEESRADNIHCSEGTALESFVEMRQKRDAQLGMPRLILPSLQVNVLGGRSPGPEDNGVSYLKTPFNASISQILSGTEA